MKDFKIGLAVVVVLALLWTGLQSFVPKTDDKSGCESGSG
jgi:hypothetical protein